MENDEGMKRLTLALVIVMSFHGVALAHDHRPPRATLRLDGDVQKGLVYHADGWTYPSEEPGFCDVDFGWGPARFRNPLVHEAGERIVVRLHKTAMPLEVEVQRWPRVEDGHAAGTPIPLPWVLRPKVVDGETAAWDVIVPIPVVDGHLYLGVGAYWADEDGCAAQPDLGSQYAAWTFHAKSR